MATQKPSPWHPALTALSPRPRVSFRKRSNRRILWPVHVGRTANCYPAQWVWNGSVSNAFDNCNNWDQPGPGCEYPDGSGDDALIPPGTWNVALTAETIGELRVEGDTTFAATNTVVFVTEGVALDADAGAISVEMDNTSGAPIIYMPPP